MIISFTCNNIGTGGAERVVCNLANQMAKEGHIVRIICYEKLSSFYYKLEENVSILELDPLINKREKKWNRKIAGILNLWRLFCAVKGSDRVISFYTRQNCYSILVSRLQRIPVICAERDHFFMSDGAFNHKMRTVFYPHANGFIHQTEMARQWLREHEGVRCKDIVVPNPLWIDEFPKREPIQGNIVAVGRLAKQKNYQQMIEAFAVVYKNCPYAKLHIYGEGASIDELKKLITNSGLEEVVFLEGMTKNVVEVYKHAEVFVMFSHGEGYPNALMEALAMGVPAVSSDCPVGGPRDMIQNGKNGFLVPCGDVKEFSNRIIELLQDSVLREKFSENAILIRESNKFEKIYRKIMKYVEDVQYGNQI